ncbi:MAG: exo-beta-N-acetylmuramidase NamZ domain-containing protein [Mangrovibacterium sp.]
MKIAVLISGLFLLMMNFVSAQAVKPGAEQPGRYLPLLKGRKVAIVVNPTSRIGKQHLADFLQEEQVELKKIFTPEHGLRGETGAGERVNNHTDAATGLPVISLYGNTRKPTEEELEGIDVVVFDLQDVGVRFYTYLSTLFYVMEACAEQDIPLVVLDRPNPNGDYVAGPVLKPEFRSFVGMIPVPVVHGCTLGELAEMINGEGWLAGGACCRLTVVPVANYTHRTSYSLPVKPSPNLPNDAAVRLYPSLCFFEATHASIGRGTIFPFQVIGYPDPSMGRFMFTPRDRPGACNPVQEGKACFGDDLRLTGPEERFTLVYFMKYYNRFSEEKIFLRSEHWFNLLAGTDRVLMDIRAGKTLDEIEASWKEDLDRYRQLRCKYLLYPE